MEKIKIGKYKEYTGREIEVVNLAKNPDTNENFVLLYYLPKNEEQMIAMPLEKFLEKVSNSAMEKYTFIE